MKLRLDWATLFSPHPQFFYLSSSPPFLCLISFWCFFSSLVFFLLSVHHLLCSFSIPPLQREGSTSGPNSSQDLVLMGRVGESSECGQREGDTCRQISLSQRMRVLLQWESVCQGHQGYLSFYCYWPPFYFAPYMGVTFICMNVFSLNSDSAVRAACGLCDLINKISF